MQKRNAIVEKQFVRSSENGLSLQRGCLTHPSFSFLFFLFYFGFSSNWQWSEQIKRTLVDNWLNPLRPDLITIRVNSTKKEDLGSIVFWKFFKKEKNPSYFLATALITISYWILFIILIPFFCPFWRQLEEFWSTYRTLLFKFANYTLVVISVAKKSSAN